MHLNNYIVTGMTFEYGCSRVWDREISYVNWPSCIQQSVDEDWSRADSTGHPDEERQETNYNLEFKCEFSGNVTCHVTWCAS